MGRMGLQCQYGSRYITGRMQGYPNLGEGLRFRKLDSGSYHDIEIHKDDVAEFVRRFFAYRAANAQMSVYDYKRRYAPKDWL